MPQCGRSGGRPGRDRSGGSLLMAITVRERTMTSSEAGVTRQVRPMCHPSGEARQLWLFKASVRIKCGLLRRPLAPPDQGRTWRSAARRLPLRSRRRRFRPAGRRDLRRSPGTPLILAASGASMWQTWPRLTVRERCLRRGARVSGMGLPSRQPASRRSRAGMWTKVDGMAR